MIASSLVSRLIDALSDEGERWTAISGAELDEMQRVILAYCGRDFKKAYRMRAAYEFIASKRDAETLNASVSDGEVSARIPKERGIGFISGSNYSRTIKRDLLACGLLEASTDRKSEATAPTVYSFLMLKRLLCIGMNRSAQRSNEDVNPLTHSEQCISIYENAQCVVHNEYAEANNSCAQASTEIHTSRKGEFEERKTSSLERGASNNPVSAVSWTPFNPPESCPYCGAYGSTAWATVEGVDLVRCEACDTEKQLSEFEQDRYLSLKNSPDILF